jgi:hypothetical protein
MEHSATGYTKTKGVVAGSGTYQFIWMPPSTNVGNVVIYVAGNAAIGDLTLNGDHIYTQTYTLTPATVNFHEYLLPPAFRLGTRVADRADLCELFAASRDLPDELYFR